MDRVQVMMNMMNDDVVVRGDEEGQGGAIPRGARHRSADDTSYDTDNVSIT